MKELPMSAARVTLPEVEMKEEAPDSDSTTGLVAIAQSDAAAVARYRAAREAQMMAKLGGLHRAVTDSGPIRQKSRP